MGEPIGMALDQILHWAEHLSVDDVPTITYVQQMSKTLVALVMHLRAHDRDIKAHDRDIKALEDQTKELNHQIKDLNHQIKCLEEVVEQQGWQIRAHTQQIQALEEERAAVEALVEELEDKGERGNVDLEALFAPAQRQN
jgi:predicted RNase H-like nuclease (RuvC/YqgF family)